MTVLRFLIVLALSLGMASTATAQLTVSGTVSDEDGVPLPGATVSAAGTITGTTTDMDGRYTLLLPAPEAPVVIEVRFIGYRTARETLSQTSGTVDLDFTMEPDILGLSEVVVTGTSGQTERRQLGNSISTVGGDALAESGATDLTAGLSGKITGALVTQTSGSPAGSISVKLRGNSTINSDAEPLYVIDGVIVDNSSNELVTVGNGGVQNRLVDINPGDIDRIEVLKGAAAAAIYGSRASNGVIQIFTKRGQAGAPRVTYSSSVQLSEVRQTLRVNEAPFEWVDPTDNLNLEKIPVERFDYQDYIFDEGLGTDQSLSISGGSDRTTYYISGSYFFNEGIIRNSDFNRTTLRVNVGQTLTDWAVLNINTSLTRSFSNDIPTGGEGFFDGAITTLQFQPHSADANANELGEYPNIGNSFFGNPFEIVDRYQYSQEINRFIGSVNVTLTPLPGLSVNGIMGYDTFGQLARGFEPVGTVAQSVGFSSRGDLTRKLFNADLNVVYNTALSDAVASTTSLGGTYQYDQSESIQNSANNLGPIVETVSGGTIISSSDFISTRSLQGAFLQQTIGLNDRLFFTVAGRVDASSVFGEDNRVQFYPKVGGSWIMSDEPFWDGFVDTVDLFKLRASWGQSGNLTGIGPFERFTNYNPVALDGLPGVIPSTALGNPDIKPETQTELEVGFDLSVLGRLGVEFTFYDQTVDDLLLSRTLSPSTGAASQIQNVGQLTNRGVELLVRANVVDTRDLDVNLTAIYSANRNEVTDLDGDGFGIGGFGSQWALEGQPLGVFYWRAYARDENGDLLLTPSDDPSGPNLPQAERGDQVDVTDPDAAIIRRDENGQPTGALLRILVGDPNPDWTGSLITEVDYRQFGFRMQWDAVQGFDVFNWNRRNYDRHNYRGGFEYGQELEEGSTIPKGTANARGSGLITEEYVEDGSFVKLREIALSYTLTPPAPWIQSVRLTLSGRNLISIDDYRGYDPEISISGRDTGVRGFDFGAVPIPRSYSLGVTLGF
ncbi:MAG: SusC/RagA family TonB-linked outer membrane protein [Bacteroidota bacterium]